MGLAHNTQRLTCRVVLRGCCWLRNTRDSQLARGAAARLLCESGSGATALPLPTNWSVLYSSEYFFALVCPFSRAFFSVVVSSNGLCLALWPRACAACSSCRSGDAPPRYEQGAEQRFLFRRKPKSRGDIGIGRRSIFFLNCFRKFDFRLAFSATRISRRRPVLRLLLLLRLAL